MTGSQNMTRSQNVAKVAAETAKTAKTADTDSNANVKKADGADNTAANVDTDGGKSTEMCNENITEMYGTIDSSNPVADSVNDSVNDSVDYNFFDQRWATYLQISNAGWHVRKGEKGTHVLLWKPNINTKEDGGMEITSVTQRIFTVFHASQIEGIPAYVPPEVNIIAAHDN